MAYAAAISIKKSLQQFYELSDKLTNIHCPAMYIERLYDMADSIQTFDFEENGLQGHSLEKKIRDALWRAEDIIESYSLRYFLSPEDNDESLGDMGQESNFSKDLKKVIQEIDSIKGMIVEFADDFKNDEENSVPVASVLPSTDDFPPVHKNKMVGLDGSLELMKEILVGESMESHYLGLGAILIHGMGGIGKTSLAISIYNDLEVRSQFSIGAWVKISLQHSARNILLNLLHTIEFFGDGELKLKDFMMALINEMKVEEMDDERLANFIRPAFRRCKYIVMVDCSCDVNISSWDYIKSILPDSNNGSRIILVSRMRLISDEFVICHYVKGFLNKSQSWNLLRQQVFGDEPCPDRELEKTGKRIAENCQGLPLAIITVGVHLTKKEKTVEYWNKVAESGNSIAYAADGEPMFDQLGLSYIQMSRYLRHIFLYMCAFPESQEISILELRRLWEAESLVDAEEFETPVDMSSEPVDYFLERDLMINIRKGTIELFTWSLHHALWHFCCSQAKKEEFFHVFDEFTTKGADSNLSSRVRRLVIRKAMLFGIDDFVDKIKQSVLSIRAMLFTGLYHPYPLTIIWGCYRMLRVLNACSIRFYEFPAEILCLKLLCYVALTLNGGDIPSGISKLRNLRSLIVHFHHIVRLYNGGPSYLPIEIWEMQQLAHLQVMGCDLPLPPRFDSLLPNLITLSGVSPHSCINEVLERIPNLFKLNISIYFAPKRNPVSTRLFNHSIPLSKLKSVSLVGTDFHFDENSEPQVVAMPESFSFSLKNLEHLSLSGCGFAWESIEPISQLPFLSALELRSHAFRGPKWELQGFGFNRLEHLLLEDLNLVYWTTRSSDHFFPCLRKVAILMCHKLEQIPLSFVHCRDLITIEVVNSSQEAEIWARSLQKELSQTRTMRFIVASQRGEFRSV